jgi:hypothetical protein
LKRIVFSDDARADIRAIPQQVAMNVLRAVHRLAETGRQHQNSSRLMTVRCASVLAVFECASPKKAAILYTSMP